MSFDYVLENDTPLVFPDTVGVADNTKYDPETQRLYDPKVEESDNDYEYIWSQNRWVSDVDLSVRKELDDTYVEIPGDVMTGALQMGDSITAADHPMFKVGRYNLESRDFLPTDDLHVLERHTLRCNEYVLGQRVAVQKNARVAGIKEPEYVTKWYKLQMSPVFNNDTPPTPEVPDEIDWASAVEFATGSDIVLSADSVDGNSYIRTIQTISETSDQVSPKPAPVESIRDTPFITHQTTKP